MLAEFARQHDQRHSRMSSCLPPVPSGRAARPGAASLVINHPPPGVVRH